MPLAIGERGSNHTHGELSFTYGPSIIVDHVQPQLIFVEGGTISVFGDYFNASEAWCRFAHASSSPLVVVGDVIDTRRIDCQAPPYSSNKLKADAQIQVSTNAYDWSDSLSFIYSPRPIVDSLHPTLGAVSGGTLSLVSRGQISSTRMICGVISRVLVQYLLSGSRPKRSIVPRLLCCQNPYMLLFRFIPQMVR